MNFRNKTYVYPCRRHQLMKLTGLLLAGSLLYGCYDESEIPCPPFPPTGEQAELAIRLTEGTATRNTGDYPTDTEKKIYSLEVLIFDAATGVRDGYRSVPRSVVVNPNGDGRNYFREIDEVTGIPITKGVKNVYIVANAPNHALAGVTTYDDFLKTSYELLNRQGLFEFPPATYNEADDITLVDWSTTGAQPSGALNMIPYQTNLTMCGYMENIPMNSNDTQYYLGYTTNGGRPPGITTGTPANGSTPFQLERLAARIAIKNITFDMPGSITVDGTTTSDYQAWINGFYVVSARQQSAYLSPYDRDVGWIPAESTYYTYLSGCSNAIYTLLFNGGGLNLPPAAANQPFDRLYEEVVSTRYDITGAAKPLWFYVFENDPGSAFPTWFVAEVNIRYYTSAGTEANRLYYYPFTFHKTSSTAPPQIKRNNQYRLNITIRGLAGIPGGTRAMPAENMYKDLLPENIPIEIEVEEGENLFPWTGFTYQ